MSVDEKLNLILKNQDDLSRKLEDNFLEMKQTILWIPVSTVAIEKGLTTDAVRKQLQNGDFEEGVDFKWKGSRIQVHQGAVERIQRKRRSSNA